MRLCVLLKTNLRSVALNWKIYGHMSSCRESLYHSEFDHIIQQLCLGRTVFLLALFKMQKMKQPVYCSWSWRIQLFINFKTKATLWICCKVSSSPFSPIDHNIDFVAMDVAVNAVAGALKAFFADLPSPLIPYSLHPELVEAASKNKHKNIT